MGPYSSPVKRSQELFEEGAPKKKRRRKKKQEVLGADWGEKEQSLGAGQQLEELHRSPQSIIPREQTLKQPTLTGFMKPAIFSYLEMEWPTRGNEASSSILMALLNYEEWAHVRNTEGGHEE